MKNLKLDKLIISMTVVIAVMCVISIAHTDGDIGAMVGGAGCCDSWCYGLPKGDIECDHNTETGPCSDWRCVLNNVVGVGCDTQEVHEGCDATVDPDGYEMHRIVRDIGSGNCVPDDPSPGFRPSPEIDYSGDCEFGPRVEGRCYHDECYGEILADWYEGESGWVCNNE